MGVKECLGITVIQELSLQQEELEKEVYFNEDFGKFILGKIEKGISLTKSELSEIIFKYLVTSKNGENGVSSNIVKLGGRYFSIINKEGCLEQPIGVSHKNN